IDLTSFPKSRADDAADLVPESLDVFRCYHNDIHRHRQSEHSDMDLAGQPARAGDTGLDDEEVEIAVRTGLTPSGRTKENDALGVCHLDHASDDLIQHRLVGPSGLERRCFRRAHSRMGRTEGSAYLCFVSPRARMEATYL